MRLTVLITISILTFTNQKLINALTFESAAKAKYLFDSNVKVKPHAGYHGDKVAL